MACALCQQSACGGQCAFTAADPQALACTLSGQLESVVDCVRDIATQLGTRPYQVALIHTRWSEGERGYGIEEVVSRVLILPTPLVLDVDSVTNTLQPYGSLEGGVEMVREISPRYTHDQLYGRTVAGEPTPDDQTFYWEITNLRPGRIDDRKRYAVASPPRYDAVKLEWSLQLRLAHPGRNRAGDPGG